MNTTLRTRLGIVTGTLCALVACSKNHTQSIPQPISTQSPPTANQPLADVQTRDAKDCPDTLAAFRVQCDDLRSQIKTEFMKSQGDSLVSKLNRLVLNLTPAEKSELALDQIILTSSLSTETAKKEAYSRFTQSIEIAMQKAGIRQRGDLYGDVHNSSDRKSQTYLGVSKKYAVIAAVSRVLESNDTVNAYKFNWHPNENVYRFSAHVLAVKSNPALSDSSGVPLQNLVGITQVNGNLFDFIEKDARMQSCQGATNMKSKSEQEAFSAIPVAASP